MSTVSVRVSLKSSQHLWKPGWLKHRKYRLDSYTNGSTSFTKWIHRLPGTSIVCDKIVRDVIAIATEAPHLSIRTPLRKVATPEDIANQILVVASPVLSGHVTGQNIMVEGGMEGRLLNKKEDIDFDAVKSSLWRVMQSAGVGQRAFKTTQVTRKQWDSEVVKAESLSTTFNLSYKMVFFNFYRWASIYWVKPPFCNFPGKVSEKPRNGYLEYTHIVGSWASLLAGLAGTLSVATESVLGAVKACGKGSRPHQHDGKSFVRQILSTDLTRLSWPPSSFWPPWAEGL